MIAAALIIAGAAVVAAVLIGRAFWRAFISIAPDFGLETERPKPVDPPQHREGEP